MHVENLIVGAGPAGLQLGYLFHSNHQPYLILEQGETCGSFFSANPHCQGLVSFHKRHTLSQDPEENRRWDWNSLLTTGYEFPFTPYSDRIYPKGEEMHNYLVDFAEHFSLAVQTNCQVTEISPKEDHSGYVVHSRDGQSFTCRTLVIATGFAKPYIPDLAGIELAQGYEAASFDTKVYKDKNVLIITDGAYGFDLAEKIQGQASVCHLARTENSTTETASTSCLLNAYTLKTLRQPVELTLSKIAEDGQGLSCTLQHCEKDSPEIQRYDLVIRATGFTFDPSLLPSQEGARPAMTPYWESPQHPNLFYAGSIMQKNEDDASAFIGGFRYNIRTLYNFIAERQYGIPRPSQRLPLDQEDLLLELIHRICRASSLWIQTCTLTDALFLDRVHCRAHYFYDLPEEHVLDPQLSLARDTLLLTYEYQDDGVSEAKHHPLLRHFVDGREKRRLALSPELSDIFQAAQISGLSLTRFGKRLEECSGHEHITPLIDFLREVLIDPCLTLPRTAASREEAVV